MYYQDCIKLGGIIHLKSKFALLFTGSSLTAQFNTCICHIPYSSPRWKYQLEVAVINQHTYVISGLKLIYI